MAEMFRRNEKRDKHTEDLMAQVRITAQKGAMDAVRFASDGMAVFHVLAGNRFKKYLQSEDEDQLGDWSGMTFKTYKDMVEMFLKLTGQDKSSPAKPQEYEELQTPPSGHGGITVDVDVEIDKPVSPDDAAKALRILSEKAEKK